MQLRFMMIINLRRCRCRTPCQLLPSMWAAAHLREVSSLSLSAANDGTIFTLAIPLTTYFIELNPTKLLLKLTNLALEGFRLWITERSSPLVSNNPQHRHSGQYGVHCTAVAVFSYTVNIQHNIHIVCMFVPLIQIKCLSTSADVL